MTHRVIVFGRDAICPKCRGRLFIGYRSERGRVEYDDCPQCKGTGFVVLTPPANDAFPYPVRRA